MSRLKEVLERRLFRDNGMLGPENPQGILNSSNELADVVRMNVGGFNTLRSTINIDNPRGIPVGNMPQYRPGEITQNVYGGGPPVSPPIPGITTAVQRRSFETPFGAQKISDFATETPGERTNRYFRETGPEYEPVLDRDEPTRSDRLAAIPGAIARNVMIGGENFMQGILNLDEDLSDYFSSPDLGGTIPLELGATINEMQRSQPEFAAEIDSYAVLIIDEQRRDSGTDPSPDELKQQVADMLYRTVEQPSIPTTVAERIEAERMALRPTESELKGPDGDIPTILIDSGTPESEIEVEPTVDQAEVEPTVDQAEVEPTVVDQAEGEPTVEDRAGGEPTVVEDQEPESTPEGQEVANTVGAVFDRFGQVKDDDLFRASLAEAKDRFIDTLPQYQGKTEFEKGMTLAKMGMAIAAGENPRAIKNIADGFLAVAPDFVEDAQQKRLYDQQVQLQAAKFGLGYMKDISTKFSEYEKTRDTPLTFFVSPGKGFTDNEGVIHPEYSPVVLDRRQLENYPFLGRLTSEKIVEEMIDGMDAATGLLIKAPGWGDLTEEFTNHTNDLDLLSTDATMLLAIDTVTKINEQGDAVGIGSYAAKKINSLFNALPKAVQQAAIGGVVDPNAFASAYAEMEEAKLNVERGPTKVQKFLGTQVDKGQLAKIYDYKTQVVANMMIRQILGEGSKNISNIDRQLAQEIVGLMTDFNRIGADPGVIAEKLDGIRKRVARSYTSNLENVNSRIKRWGTVEGEASTDLQNQANRTYAELRELREDEYAKRGFTEAGTLTPFQSGLFQGTGALETTATGERRGPVIRIADYFDADFNLKEGMTLP